MAMISKKDVYRGATKTTFGCADGFEKCQENFNRWFGPNGGGTFTMDYRSEDGTVTTGHCITWKMRDGNLRFTDYKEGHDHDYIINNLLKRADPNGQLAVFNLDKAEPDFEAIAKHCFVKYH